MHNSFGSIQRTPAVNLAPGVSGVAVLVLQSSTCVTAPGPWPPTVVFVQTLTALQFLSPFRILPLRCMFENQRIRVLTCPSWSALPVCQAAECSGGRPLAYPTVGLNVGAVFQPPCCPQGWASARPFHFSLFYPELFTLYHRDHLQLLLLQRKRCCLVVARVDRQSHRCASSFVTRP